MTKSHRRPVLVPMPRRIRRSRPRLRRRPGAPRPAPSFLSASPDPAAAWPGQRHCTTGTTNHPVLMTWERPFCAEGAASSCRCPKIPMCSRRRGIWMRACRRLVVNPLLPATSATQTAWRRGGGGDAPAGATVSRSSPTYSLDEFVVLACDGIWDRQTNRAGPGGERRGRGRGRGGTGPRRPGCQELVSPRREWGRHASPTREG